MPPAHLYQKAPIEKKEGNIDEILNPPEEDEEQKREREMMKKYYRNRYHSFLKAIMEQNKKREKDLEEMKVKEEKRKEKLKENLGITNVQSRIYEEPHPKKEVIVEEVKLPVKKKEQNTKRGSSLAPMKSTSSTTNFNRTAKEDDMQSTTTESTIN